MNINHKLLQRFLKQVGENLAGDWVIIGGAVLQLLNLDIRVTTDIDIVGPESATQKDSLKLMDIAASLNLPVEAINQAAAYFLYKIDNWQDSIVLVHQGSGARIFRPDANLFITLKLARLTPSDLDDCLAMIEYAIATKETIDAKRLIRLIAAKAKGETNAARRERSMKLKKALMAV